jgi:hypothetical protein
VAAVATGEALRLNLKAPSLREIVWVSSGFFILYLTAARTTYTARFYGTFAAHLKLEYARIYSLDPAHSLQVSRIASVGKSILVFWLSIVCLVATLVPFFSEGIPQFVKFVVPTASFFSAIFGTIVFLISERDIRSIVKSITESTLQSIEDEIAALFAHRAQLDDLELKRLSMLIALHDKLATTGSYRSALLSALSLLIPLVGPAVAIWPHLKPIVKPLLTSVKP